MARTLTAIRLDEISGVDRPAQKGAKALIAKRGDLDRHLAPLRDAIAKATGKQEGEPMTIAKAKGDFMSKVREIAKRDNILQTKAMEKAATEFPEEFAAMQRCAPANECDEPSTTLAKAQGDWNAAVAAIAKRDSIPTTKAMEKAATEHQGLLEAYQSAQ